MKKKLLLLLFSFLLALVLAEVAIRLYGDPRITAQQVLREGIAQGEQPANMCLADAGMLQFSEDPILRYGLQPGFEFSVGENLYRINALGMRGPELPKEKSAGVQRILLLGDSYAFGLGVGEDATIAAQLQDRLQPGHQGLQVLNMGVPGYHTGQQLRALQQQGFDLQPDLVILVYYANDNVASTFMYDPRLRFLYVDELPLTYGMKSFMSRSALYALVTKAYTGSLQRADYFDSRGPQHWSVTQKRIKAVVRACGQRNLPILLVALPALFNSVDMVNEKGTTIPDQQRVLDLAEDVGVPVVDYRALLLKRQRAVEELFVSLKPEDTHLNRQGYALLVDLIMEQIQAQQWLR